MQAASAFVCYAQCYGEHRCADICIKLVLLWIQISRVLISDRELARLGSSPLGRGQEPRLGSLGAGRARAEEQEPEATLYPPDWARGGAQWRGHTGQRGEEWTRKACVSKRAGMLQRRPRTTKGSTGHRGRGYEKGEHA